MTWIYPDMAPTANDMRTRTERVTAYELNRALSWLSAGGRGGRTFRDLVIAIGGWCAARSVLREAKRRGFVERVPRSDVPAGKATSRWRVTQ